MRTSRRVDVAQIKLSRGGAEEAERVAAIAIPIADDRRVNIASAEVAAFEWFMPQCAPLPSAVTAFALAW